MHFERRSFCFTGKFLYGTRRACETAVVELGGEITPRVTRNLHYLVIGTLVSRDWAHTSHGRKIEMAIEYRETGAGIAIIAEEHWTRYL